jgi:hypothetical protein
MTCCMKVTAESNTAKYIRSSEGKDRKLAR